MSRVAEKIEALIPPVWIRGPQLRARWSMSHSTFHRRMKAGLLPTPEYPFGDRPHWRMTQVQAFEDQAGQAQQKKKA